MGLWFMIFLTMELFAAIASFVSQGFCLAIGALLVPLFFVVFPLEFLYES